jgi:hypothetical protein
MGLTVRARRETDFAALELALAARLNADLLARIVFHDDRSFSRLAAATGLLGELVAALAARAGFAHPNHPTRLLPTA